MGKSEQPGHYTEAGTRKYQANGPVAWGAVYRRVAGRDGREGEGIRAALAFAAAHEEQLLKWAESHIGAWAPASSAPKAKAPKAPKAPKAVKAPKAPKAKAGKGARASKPAGKGAKAREAVPMAVPRAKAAKRKQAELPIDGAAPAAGGEA